MMFMMRRKQYSFSLFLVLMLLMLASVFVAGCAGAAKPKASAPSGAVQTGKPSSASTADANVIVKKLLLSAGRNADAQQPETGFSLRVPDQIWAGEPFPILFGGEGLQKVVVHWKGKSLALTPGADQSPCQALLATSLAEKEASLPLGLTVHWANGKVENFKAALPVKKRTYPVQRLKVQQKYVTPPPEVLAKIKQDRAQLRAAISPITPVRHWTLPMLRPVPGEVTSLYGLRRVFNGQERDPHKGVDFDAKEGDPIFAMDNGVVVLVADHYYSGNIVAVDHGLGVYSIYLHLSAFNVKVGQRVARGDTVGLIGSTGRVTGPHLHLSFCVLGDMVNGAACMDM